MLESFYHHSDIKLRYTHEITSNARNCASMYFSENLFIPRDGDKKKRKTRLKGQKIHKQILERKGFRVIKTFNYKPKGSASLFCLFLKYI